MIYTGDCDVSDEARRVLEAACAHAAREGETYVTRDHLRSALDAAGSGESEANGCAEYEIPTATRPLQEIVDRANEGGRITLESLRSSFSCPKEHHD